MDKQLSDKRDQKLKMLNRAKKYVSDNGYGSGSNLTIATMTALMANFAQYEIEDSLLNQRSEAIKEASPSDKKILSLANRIITSYKAGHKITNGIDYEIETFFILNEQKEKKEVGIKNGDIVTYKSIDSIGIKFKFSKEVPSGYLLYDHGGREFWADKTEVKKDQTERNIKAIEATTKDLDTEEKVEEFFERAGIKEGQPETNIYKKPCPSCGSPLKFNGPNLKCTKCGSMYDIPGFDY